MTQREAHALVQREVSKRVRRGIRGKWGADNDKILRKIHADYIDLRQHPRLFNMVMYQRLPYGRVISDGAFLTLCAPGAE